MKTAIPYQITVRWSVQDTSYEASVPALRGCLAFGDTPEEAAREVTIAAELWLEAAIKHGKPVPAQDTSLERLAAMAPVLNMAAIARQSGISPQTLASKIQRGSTLSETERKSLGSTLGSYGIRP
jgi:predicted RNase H-like HicB family nuclease